MAKKKKGFYDTPHVYVATPAYDGKVDTDFAMSLANSSWHAGLFGIQVTSAVMGNGAFIDLARNTFVKMFLEDQPDCTHLFFIDSDLKFEVRAFVELARHCTEDRPVIAGAYRRRQEPEDYPIMWTPHPELSNDGVEKLWFDEQGFMMCTRVPTGFLCIRRNIIEEMAEEAVDLEIKGFGKVPRLFYTYLDEKNRFIGEDFAWCDDYKKKYNKPISVWTDFDFVHGGFKCNYQRWLEKHAAKNGEDSEGFGLLKPDPQTPTRSAA